MNQVIEASSAVGAAEENARRVRAMLDYYVLPAPMLIGRADGVHVITHSTEDLLEWLALSSGTVRVSRTDDVELWTLRTVMPPNADGRAVQVWVSAPLAAGELVPHELQAAVVADPVPVDGPFRVGVRQLPLGAGLDVSSYLRHVVTELAQIAEEDPEGLVENLQEIAALARSARAKGLDSYATHERDQRIEDLLDEVAEGGVLPVYGVQVGRLADRLRDAGASVEARTAVTA